MKIAIIGANGQLGCDLCHEFRENGDEILDINHDLVDVADMNSLANLLESLRPQVVINTAARHHIESCEENPERAFEVNSLGPRNLALLSNRFDFVLVQISTDYVFNGRKREPYVEGDLPMPLNVYGNTKLSGEYFVRVHSRRHFVLRVSSLYGRNPCRAKGGMNFVSLMLKLGREKGKVRVVNDEIVTPTYTRHLARQIVHLLPTEVYGLYHISPQGGCSWYVFAEKIFQISGMPVKLEVASPDEFPVKVSRPKYSVMDNYNLQLIGVDRMLHWEAGLEDFFREIP